MFLPPKASAFQVLWSPDENWTYGHVKVICFMECFYHLICWQ